MSADRTPALLDELARDLKPVRPLPRLRWLVAGLLLVGGVELALKLAAGGLSPGLSGGAPSASFVVVMAGLLGAALGGIVGGLASALPGREGAQRAGGLLAAVGVLLALGAAGVLAWLRGDVTPLAADGMCFRASLLYGVPPALVAGGLVARGWVGSPWPTAALVLLGAGAVGGLAVHAGCALEGPRHMWIGHGWPMLLVAGAGALLVAPLLRRLAR